MVIEQTSAAQHAAQKLGVELGIVYAGNDGIVQSQQLLSSVQSTTGPRPDAIIFEPAGSTAHPQVARAAAAAGIGVVLLNHEANYIAELRRQFHVPAFAITSNHEEVGRIQGQQLGTLLPNGGTFSTSKVPANIQPPNDATPGCWKPSPTACNSAS